MRMQYTVEKLFILKKRFQNCWELDYAETIGKQE